MPASFRLDGKTAIVAGAGRGIGRACAIALAAAGADVVAISRTAEELDEVAHEIALVGGSCQTATGDLTDGGWFEAMLRDVESLDVLVNSAGTNLPGPLTALTDAALDRMLDINLRAVITTARAAVRRMRELGAGGSIVTISSQMGHVGASDRTVYCATKHGVEGFTKALAIEGAVDGIRANTVSPTFIETAMTRGFLADPEFRAAVLASIPMGRLGTVDDVAAAVVFLASPAASFITGTSIVVDGGWTAR